MAITIKLREGPQDRGERGYYLVKSSDITDSGIVQFHRIGEGFADANENLNPQVKQRSYISGKSSSVTTGYQESWPISGERYVGDYANDLLARMAETRAKGPDAALNVLTVNFYEEAVDDTAPDTPLGIYRAFRQQASYSPESGGGGAATDSVTISGTINGSGQPIEGWFKPNGVPGTENPVDYDIVPRDRGLFSTNIEDLLAPVTP